ncbi:hypothetical protein [Streptomyces sp. NPDC051569]|uniref:hypothetical protein n=1 Tax=Streptomyces sp. NPDC051569 TaxID=3365661 RepID=UPI00379708DF
MSNIHPATAQVLRHFAYDHLPPHLQAVSVQFHDLTHRLAATLTGPELTHALVRLLEAKDWAVRAALTDATPED